MRVEQMTLPETDTEAQRGKSDLLEAPQLMRGRVGWGPQLSPAVKAGAPRLAQSPELSGLEGSLDPGFRAWGEAAAVSMWGQSQARLRRPGPRPVWAWEGACSPATPVPPGPWGGVSHLCWSLVRFLSSPGGRVQGKWAPASMNHHRPACQSGCQAPDRQEKPAGRDQAGSILTGPGAGIGGNSSGLGGWAAPTHSAPYSLLQLGQWSRSPPRPLRGGEAVGGHVPNLSQSGLAGPRPCTTIYSTVFCHFTGFFFT